MGLGDFFKNIFGKKTCAFCGCECGMMNRTKIKGDEFICGTCDDMCSQHIRKCDFTKAELEGHMTYMKHLDRIYKELIKGNSKKRHMYPSGIDCQTIEFFDDFGMFRIVDKSRESNERYPKELFRYDQIASYEPYIEEREAAESGKPKEFAGCGLELSLVGAKDNMSAAKLGTKAHPYITKKIRICFTKKASDKERHLKYLDEAIAHLDLIFGVNSDRRGLFQFGMTEKEKRDLKAGVALVNTFATAVKAAKNGEDSVSEEEKAAMLTNLNAVDDAATNGLSVYSRLADEAEAKIS